MFMIHKIRNEILDVMICLKWHCKAQLMRIISILVGIIMEKKRKGEQEKWIYQSETQLG